MGTGWMVSWQCWWPSTAGAAPAAMRVIARRCSTRCPGSPLHHRFRQHELGQVCFFTLRAALWPLRSKILPLLSLVSGFLAQRSRP
uniref:Secreted protein n=1 Tax=Arundo donax TaxID=35708 RepID=A0A0A9DYB0_ARUDO